VAFNTSLENNYTSIHTDIAKHFPRASQDNIGESLIRQLVPGDKVSVKLVQKHVKAEILEIIPQMNAAYLSFEDFPSVYDEYQPCDLLRLPSREEIPVGDIKPGLLVLDFSSSNEYRARIQSTQHGTMARVKMTVSEHQMVRLISPDMILGRYIPPVRRSKKKYEKAVFDTEVCDEVAPPLEVLVDQVVQTFGRGAAIVTGIHTEKSSITHVDLRYLIGKQTTECMVPIKNIWLAPELNADSGNANCPVALIDLSQSSDVDESVGGGSNFSDNNNAHENMKTDLTSQSSDVDKSGGDGSNFSDNENDAHEKMKTDLTSQSSDVDESGGDGSNFSDNNNAHENMKTDLTSQSSDVDKSGGDGSNFSDNENDAHENMKTDLTSQSSDVDKSGGGGSNFSDNNNTHENMKTDLTSQSSDVDKSGGDGSNFSDENKNDGQDNIS
jgi:hypothetical protein